MIWPYHTIPFIPLPYHNIHTITIPYHSYHAICHTMVWPYHTVLYPPPWLLADSGRLRQECWNSIWNLPECLESIILLDSNGIQVEFHSNRFQVHSAGFQGPFQPIPAHSKGHSNTFQHISWAIPTHSRWKSIPMDSKCHPNVM